MASSAPGMFLCAPYTVKFDANGGEGEMPDATFYWELAQELPANQFKRAGHLFAGWSTAADGSSEIFPDKAMVKNLAEKGQTEVTLYAQWNVMYNVSVPTVDHIKVNFLAVDACGELG